MHMLACDPGIIAIMNKHRWQVGIMTEMAPVGYVGVSPKCIIGFNKNMGEEIPLRLRTDDLKGFRKYESIKKTLLHELAHKVHSEHDAHFFALNKQLNEEAASLDWTKSSGHVLSGRKIFDSYEHEFDLEPEDRVVGHKLGGGSSSLASACVLQGVAAYQLLLSASSTDLGSSHSSVTKSVEKYNVQGTQAEPDPDDAGQDFIQENVKAEPDPDDNDAMPIDVGSAGFVASTEQNTRGYSEPVPDDVAKKSSVGCLEPDPDDSADVDMLNKEINGEHDNEPDPDDGTSEFVLESRNKTEVEMELRIDSTVLKSEPDPDDSSSSIQNQEVCIDGKRMGEPDLDASTCGAVLKPGNKIRAEIGQSRKHSVLESEPNPDDHAANLKRDELQRIEEPVAALCSCLQ
uniref:WLM domain-containing protein n=1 Tax=Triticum urartu TaxID=4572 RepID=A0A8R7R298_TRIUA